MRKKKKRFVKKLIALSMVLAFAFQATGCGSGEAGGDQPGHGKWINSSLPENAQLCAEQRLQDDFAAAVNAEWNVSQNFDPSVSYGVGSLETSDQITKERFLDTVKDTSIQDPNVEKLRTYYGLYTDWEYRAQTGVEPLRKYMSYIDEIRSLEDVYQYMTDSSKNPFAAMLFTFSLEQTDHFSLRIDQPSYSLGKSNRYLELADEGLQKKEQVTNGIRYLMGRLGFSEDEADQLLDQCFSFELKMAELSPGGSDFVDRFADLSISDVESIAGDFPIRKFMDHFGLDKFQGYCVDADYLRGLSGVCTEANLEKIKAYFKVLLMRKAIEYLDQESYLKAKEIKLDKANPYDEVVVKPIEHAFYSEVLSSPLSGLGSQVYLDRFYDEEVAKDIESMCRDFVREYHDLITEKDWLSDENKERILGKLDAMHFIIMKPSNEADYSGVSFVSKEDNGNLLDAYCEISRFDLENMGRLSAEKIDRDFWNIYDPTTTTMMANSFYDPLRNAFVIDIGAVNGDMYSKDMSYEDKLGHIGCLIGHELSHAFDSAGVNFDAEGKLNALLIGDDMSTFNEKADKVREYFGEVRFQDLPCYYDGSVDISGEAIADMGGVKCALKLGKKVDGFDYDAFFRSYASYWGELRSKGVWVMLIRTDVHPISYLRINITVQQFDEFYETYGIQPGDGMYVAPEDRIAIW
ncbi:MAG: M13 family metallopeptidase [Eubacterium sp.]|nr:M13 family metallopeptidase [Eubacterium sp.]